MDRSTWNKARKAAELTAGEFADKNTNCQIVALLLVADVLFELVQEIEALRGSVEEYVNRG